MFKDLTIAQICDYLKNTPKTVIVFHAHPDGDAVGSAFALSDLITALGNSAYCVCADELPNRLRFIADGKQDSVLPGSLPEEFVNAAVISVDTAAADQLGSLTARFRPELMIDHHISGTRFADGMVSPSSAATGEIIFALSRYLLKTGAAKGLPEGFNERIYAAVSSDTGCFRYANTTPETHLCAAELLRSGVDAASVNRRLFEIKTHSQLNAERAALDRLRTYHEGRIAVAAFSASELSALDIDKEDYGVFTDVARSVAEADVAFSVRNAPGECGCRVSMRSSGDINVAGICEAFGGGGHIRAAGCTIPGTDVEKAVIAVVAETERRMK